MSHRSHVKFVVFNTASIVLRYIPVSCATYLTHIIMLPMEAAFIVTRRKTFSLMRTIFIAVSSAIWANASSVHLSHHAGFATSMITMCLTPPPYCVSNAKFLIAPNAKISLLVKCVMKAICTSSTNKQSNVNSIKQSFSRLRKMDAMGLWLQFQCGIRFLRAFKTKFKYWIKELTSPVWMKINNKTYWQFMLSMFGVLLMSQYSSTCQKVKLCKLTTIQQSLWYITNKPNATKQT
jgi:hypothetical protein